MAKSQGQCDQPAEISLSNAVERQQAHHPLFDVAVAGSLAGEAKTEPAASFVPDTLEAIREALVDIRSLIEARLLYDETKEEAFRQLYADLDQFRGQASFLQSRPLYLELILLLDRIESNLEVWSDNEKVSGLLESFRDELLEILARRSIEQMPSTQDTFDPTCHRAISVELSDRSEEHNTIARVVRRGYKAEGKVLRPSEVVVRRYKPSASHEEAQRER